MHIAILIKALISFGFALIVFGVIINALADFAKQWMPFLEEEAIEDEGTDFINF